MLKGCSIHIEYRWAEGKQIVFRLLRQNCWVATLISS